MELIFFNSSNDIISGDLDENPPDRDKVSGEVEQEKKINDSDIEISEYYGKDTEEDVNIKSDVCSESREHGVFDND